MHCPSACPVRCVRGGPASRPGASDSSVDSSIQLRPADPADALRLAALAIQVWLHNYATGGVSAPLAHYVLTEFTERKFLARLARQGAALLVAEVEARLVGFAAVGFGLPCPADRACSVELQTLYVQEHFTRQGVGSALLARSEALGQARAGSALWLAVNAQNDRARAFYAARGYRHVADTDFALGGQLHRNLVLLAPVRPQPG